MEGIPGVDEWYTITAGHVGIPYLQVQNGILTGRKFTGKSNQLKVTLLPSWCPSNS